MAETNYVRQVIDNANDTKTNTIGVIDAVHKRIHAGKHFIAAIDITASQSTDELNIFLKSGGTTEKDRHAVWEISADKAGAIFLFEDILDSGGGGTTQYYVNSNRLSGTTTPHSIRLMGTTFTTDTADVIWNGYVGGGNPPVRIGGQSENREEFILASSKEYMLQFVPALDATRVLIVSSFYTE